MVCRIESGWWFTQEPEEEGEEEEEEEDVEDDATEDVDDTTENVDDMSGMEMLLAKRLRDVSGG